MVKMVQQALHFHEYYLFVFVFIICGWVLWNIVRIGILSLFGIPAIVLDDDTIYLTAIGYNIAWKDIKDISLEVNHARFTSYTLLVQVNDPWTYISEIKNPIMRNYRWFTRNTNNCFGAALTNVEGDPNDVYRLIESYYNRNK